MTSMRELVLKLLEFDYIKIVPENNLKFEDIDYCCGNLFAYFVNNQILRIGQETPGEFFEPFIENLKKTIHGKLLLHDSLVKNLGFMINEYYHAEYPRDKNTFVEVVGSNGKTRFWVGLNYQVWTTFADADLHVSTWLYNNTNGDIVLEVTPDYKWHFSVLEGKPEDPNFVTYEEFMKDYNPLLRRVIPREIATEWLDQAMKAYRGFFSTEENYINRCKKLGW